MRRACLVDMVDSEPWLIKAQDLSGALFPVRCAWVVVESGHEQEVCLWWLGQHLDACSRLAAERDSMWCISTGPASGRAARGRAHIHGDINDRRAMAQALASEAFDVVVNWIVFDPRSGRRCGDVRRQDQTIRLHQHGHGLPEPPRHYVVTEETPLENPSGSTRRKRSPPNAS